MVDWSRIDELCEDLGEEDFDDVIAMFLEEVEERLKLLQSGGYDSLPDELHFLKGSAANLGFQTFRGACEAAERSGLPEDIPKVLNCYWASKTKFLDGRRDRAQVA